MSELGAVCRASVITKLSGLVDASPEAKEAVELSLALIEDNPDRLYNGNDRIEIVERIVSVADFLNSDGNGIFEREGVK